MEGTLPASVFALEKLETLDLSHNKLSGSVSEVPVGALSNLRKISLAGNQITGVVPLSLLTLQKLTSVDVSDNMITGVEEPAVLADVDWLHGGAETLLTTSNLFLGFGLAGALSAGKLEPMGEESFPKAQAIAAGLLAFTVYASAFAGPGLGLEQHSALLFGLGNLPADLLSGLPIALHAEPENALSIPTWAIHS